MGKWEKPSVQNNKNDKKGEKGSAVEGGTEIKAKRNGENQQNSLT